MAGGLDERHLEMCSTCLHIFESYTKAFVADQTTFEQSDMTLFETFVEIEYSIVPKTLRNVDTKGYSRWHIFRNWGNLSIKRQFQGTISLDCLPKQTAFGVKAVKVFVSCLLL